MTIETKIAANGAVNCYLDGKKIKEADAVRIARDNDLPYYMAHALSYTDRTADASFISPISAWKWLRRLARKSINYHDGSISIERCDANGTTEIYLDAEKVEKIKDAELKTYIDAFYVKQSLEMAYQAALRFVNYYVTEEALTEEQAQQIFVAVHADKIDNKTVRAMVKNFREANGIVEVEPEITPEQDIANSFEKASNRINGYIKVYKLHNVQAEKLFIFATLNSDNEKAFYDLLHSYEAANEADRASLDCRTTVEAQDAAIDAEIELASVNTKSTTEESAPVDDFGAKLTELQANVDAAQADYDVAIANLDAKKAELRELQVVVGAAEDAKKVARNNLDNERKALSRFMDYKVKELTNTLILADKFLMHDYTIRLYDQDGARITGSCDQLYFHTMFLKFDINMPRHVATYDTPAQVTAAINQLKDAIERGDKEFKFPTIDELDTQNAMGVFKKIYRFGRLRHVVASNGQHMWHSYGRRISAMERDSILKEYGITVDAFLAAEKQFQIEEDARLDAALKAHDQARFLWDKIQRESKPLDDDNVANLLPKVDELNDVQVDEPIIIAKFEAGKDYLLHAHTATRRPLIRKFKVLNHGKVYLTIAEYNRFGTLSSAERCKITNNGKSEYVIVFNIDNGLYYELYAKDVANEPPAPYKPQCSWNNPHNYGDPGNLNFDPNDRLRAYQDTVDDKLIRAMRDTLLRVQAACKSHDINAALYELKLFAICRDAHKVESEKEFTPTPKRDRQSNDAASYEEIEAKAVKYDDAVKDLEEQIATVEDECAFIDRGLRLIQKRDKLATHRDRLYLTIEKLEAQAI